MIRQLKIGVYGSRFKLLFRFKFFSKLNAVYRVSMVLTVMLLVCLQEDGLKISDSLPRSKALHCFVPVLLYQLDLYMPWHRSYFANEMPQLKDSITSMKLLA